MAGNILRKGYIAGVGMTIGTVFGRIAGEEAARHASTLSSIAHGEHVMTVCNACRYCEQFCPVFPAMEKRLTFAQGGSRAISPTCATTAASVSTPASTRRRTSSASTCRDARGDPRAFVRGLLLAAVPGERLQASQPADRPRSRRRSDRCDGSPPPDCERWSVPAARRPAATSTPSCRTTSWSALFGGVFVFVVAAIGIGVVRFWRDIRSSEAHSPTAADVARALGDVLTLRHLHGSGADCTSAEEQRAPLAALVPSLHVLRIPAVFRVDVGRGRLSLCVRMAGAVSVRQPSCAPRDGGRRRAAGRPGRAAARAGTERPGARRSRPARSGRVVHRAAVSDQPHADFCCWPFASGR